MVLTVVKKFVKNYHYSVNFVPTKSINNILIEIVAMMFDLKCVKEALFDLKHW